MSTEPIFSIIIPVYNVSGYLRDCLDSIINQKITEEIEIILINDGSTDDSANICEEYTKKDNRISIIHQENQGAAEARNAGIRVSTGKYLLFIDADDYIIDNSLWNIIKCIKTDGDCDITLLNAKLVHQNGRVKDWSYRYSKERIYKQTKEDVLSYIVGLSRIPVSPCIKLLNRDFIFKNNLLFTKGIACEDVDHTYKVLLAAESFNCCDFPYYYARYHREGSSMTSSKYALKRFGSTHLIIKKWLDISPKDSPNKEIIHGFLAIQYIYLIAMYYDISTTEKSKYKEEVQNLSWLLNHGKNWKFIPLKAFYNIFRLKICSLLFNKLLL